MASNRRLRLALRAAGAALAVAIVCAGAALTGVAAAASHDHHVGSEGTTVTPAAPTTTVETPAAPAAATSAAIEPAPASAPASPATQSGHTKSAGEARHRGRAGEGGARRQPGGAGSPGRTRHQTNGSGPSANKAGSTAGGRGSSGPARARHDTSKESNHGRSTPLAPAAMTPAVRSTAPESAVASAAQAPPATPAPAPTAVSTPAPAATPAPASAHAHAPTAKRTHRAARARRQPAATGGATAALAGGLLPAATTAATAGTDTTAAGERPAPARKATPPKGESPLVKTVTKIIDVVPTPIRILIAALVALALALAAVSRLSAIRARRLARQRSQLLADVGLLQAALLPPLPERLGPVGTSAAYRPASGPGAGGDFYDVFALGDGQLAVIVGDVSGHGRQALPHTTLVRYTLRAYLEAGLSPRAALQTAAPVLERQLGDTFATVVLATYHPRDRMLVFSCAGHPPPLVLGTEGIDPITACSAPPIGVGKLTGTRQTSVRVPGGALACFYTDGVVEARLAGELYGQQRLERTLVELGPEARAQELLERVAEQSERQPDDMAACVLRIEGPAAAPAVRVEELELDAAQAAGDRPERFLLAGGMAPDETEEALAEVRAAAQAHGRVVIELHLGVGAPQMVLRPQNVSVLQPQLRSVAGSRGGRA